MGGTNYNLFPPKFCPNAVPTRKGWCHPTTGEVLVAVRGLAGATDAPAVSTAALIAQVKAEVPVVEPVVEQEVQNEPEQEDEQIIDPISGVVLAEEAPTESIAEPVKRKGGRPKKG